MSFPTTRAELLRWIEDDPAAGPGSPTYIIAARLTERLKPGAVAAISPTIVANLVPEVNAADVYNALLRLAAAGLFDVVFSVRNDMQARVPLDTSAVRAHLAHSVPLVHPDTGEEVGMSDVEVTFRGSDQLRSMLL